MQALTGRPLLQTAVGRATHSSGQTTLHLTPQHGKANRLKALIASICVALRHVKAAAEQFKTQTDGQYFCGYVGDRIVPTLGPFKPPPWLPATW